MNQLLIYGPLVIGPLLAYLLFGAYLVQLGQYVLSPVESERWTIYAAVVFVTLLETACMVLMSVYTWKALFTPGGPYYVIVNSNWSPTSPALYGLVAVIVHMFFAWKIKALGRNRWVRLLLPCIIFVLTITQFAASIGTTVQFSVVNGVNIKPDILRPTVILQRVASLACDTLITLSMIAILLNYKSSTRLRATQKLLNGLIINSVENGAVTVVVLALSLGLYLWHPNDFLHVALYANVLLASLNGRTLHKWERRFATEAEDETDTAILLYDSEMVTPGERYQTPRWPHRVLMIAMKEFSVCRARPYGFRSPGVQTLGVGPARGRSSSTTPLPLRSSPMSSSLSPRRPGSGSALPPTPPRLSTPSDDGSVTVRNSGESNGGVVQFGEEV